MNFTPQQQHSLLSKMGYSGPVDSRMMEQFIQSNPGAAAKMGKFDRAMKRGFSRGGKVSGYQAGGLTSQEQAEYNRLKSIPGQDRLPQDRVRLQQLQQKQLGQPTGGVILNPYQASQLSAEEREAKNVTVREPGKSIATTPVMPSPTPQEPIATTPVMPSPTPQPTGGVILNPYQASQLSAEEREAKNVTVRERFDVFTGSTEEAKQEFLSAQKDLVNKQRALDAFTPKIITGEDGKVRFEEGEGISQTFDSVEEAQKFIEENIPVYRSARDALETAQKAYTEKEQNLALARQVQQQTMMSAPEVAQKAIEDPSSLVTKADTVAIQETPGQIMQEGAGVVAGEAPKAAVSTAAPAAMAETPLATPAATMEAATVTPAVTEAVGDLEAAKGEVSRTITAEAFDPQQLAQLGLSAPQIDQARQIANIPDLALTQDQLAKAATLASTGLPLPQAVAQTTGEDFTAIAAKFTGQTPEAIAQDQYNLTPAQAAQIQETQVQEAAKASEIPSAEAAQSSFQSDIQAAQGQIGVNELVNAKDIIGAEKAIEAIAAINEELDEAARANAAQGTFSQNAIAKAAQGSVTAESTVQGQMSKLMKQFDDGTPAWAAGAMRAANAAMAARGIGGSSMASAAIVQAAMESAIPIASQDAQAFQQMNLTNLNNRQQVALANAAAYQNLELTNLNNRQQAVLQNSSNAFALQSQNLTNTQQVVIANAQFKAALQTQRLDIKTQAALANAAKYAEMNQINLSNEQQTRLQNSAQNLQVDIANLSNRQQTALSNLQVRASLIGQELSNEQQMAVLQSTQEFEAAGIDASNQQQAFMQDAAAQAALEGRALDARQQTALFNVSSQLREREIELTNEQQTRLFNTTNAMNIEMANLSNKQQTALANAQIEAAIRGQELSNTQQVNVVNAARISEIANINFNEEQQKAIENARLAQTVDIENLNTAQAKLMADVASMAQMDMANLNNRQQAAVQNAQNFLQMDLTNLSNEQQTSIFKTQQRVNALLSDQAAENAAEQFNAASENQTNQFFADLQSTISRFNADQTNAVNQFNAGQENATEQFNASLQEQRDQFNANNRLIVAQANAKWRQDIATLDTAAQNEAIMEAAKTANALTATAMDELWLRERDLMSFSFQAAENAQDRYTELLIADKTFTTEQILQAQELSAADKAGKGAIFGSIAGQVVGGIVDSIF